MRFRLRFLLLCFVFSFAFLYGNEKIVVLPGTFQSVLGGNNWDPTGESTKMTTKNGEIYEFTTVLPAGSYEFKVAINETWEENYGQNGEPDGPNIKLIVKNSYTKLNFIFDYKTKKIEQEILGIVSADEFKKIAPIVKEETPMKENILLKTKEYIEKSPTETLFLFKAPVGAKIDFYIGESAQTLKKVIIDKENDGKGLVVGSLVSGKTYQYKIVSKYLGKTIESNIETYTKETLIKTENRPQWAKDAVFYEVFVRSFYDKTGDKIGDFAGLQEKLPYLKDLGVTGLWLMPINSSPSYHGYDVVDFKNLNKDYGTIEEFKSFLQEAEKNGIKVIMDFVLNHTSNNHPWFKEGAKDINSPYRDYYVWADAFDNTKKLGDWSQQTWHNYASSKYYGVFWGGMPDLNYRNPSVRKEIKDATKFWLDLGVDGFRLDASRYIDSNNDVTQLWWNDFNTYVKTINKDAFIVGENWDNSMDFVGQFMASMDSSFNFSFRDLIVNMAKGNEVNLIEELSLRDDIYSNYNKNFIDSLFIGNHDMARVASDLKGNIQSQKFALSILLTLPGTPFLYYGEEIGLLGTKPDENLREPMDWYKSAKGEGMTDMKVGKITYTKSNDGISVEEQSADKNSLLNFTKKLIKIRKDNPVIVNGTYKTLDLGYKINAYKISSDKESITIIHNSNNSPISYEKIKIDGLSTAIIKNGKDLLTE